MRHKKRVINLLEHGILHGRKQNTSYRVCFCLLGRENVNIRLFFCKPPFSRKKHFLCSRFLISKREGYEERRNGKADKYDRRKNR